MIDNGIQRCQVTKNESGSFPNIISGVQKAHMIACVANKFIVFLLKREHGIQI